MEFDGAVILISHDRHLVEATADRLWIVKGGTVKSYDGDMDSYRTELLAERGAKGREKSRERDSEGTESRADQRRAAADRRAELAPLKKAMQTAEKIVERLHAEIAKLDAVLAEPDLYAQNPQKAQKTAVDRGQLAKKLAEAEDAWLAATEAYEGVAAG
jgi:ATP-binding cassette subfamily F protein 3